MENIRKLLEGDRFAVGTGVELVEARPGAARTRMVIGEGHLNSLGIVHGGAIFTLGAVAFFAACNAGGNLAVGINLSISFLKSATAGTLEAEAIEVARSKRISTCTIRVVDGGGSPVALLQGTAYLKS